MHSPLSSRVLGSRLILSVVALLVMGSGSALGQTFTAILQKTSNAQVQPVTIQVPADKVFELTTFLHHSPAAANSPWALAVNGLVLTRSQVSETPTAPLNVSLVGPATLTVSFMEENTNMLEIGDGCVVTYKLKDNGAAGGASTPFSGTSVVIPADAAGPVQIILESSTDLLNWVAATPGSYGASTQRRFFRVRAVGQ